VNIFKTGKVIKHEA